MRSRRRFPVVDGLGAEPVIADVSGDPDILQEVFQRSEVVINAAAAAGPDPAAVAMIDRDGAITAIRAAERAGVRRYVQLSAMFSDAPDQGDPLIRSILVAKQISDTVLRRSSLTWTVVRAGTLTDEPGTGRVTVAEHLGPGRVSREDVAAVAVASLTESATERRGFDVHAGDQAVRLALATLGRRINPQNYG